MIYQYLIRHLTLDSCKWYICRYKDFVKPEHPNKEEYLLISNEWSSTCGSRGFYDTPEQAASMLRWNLMFEAEKASEEPRTYMYGDIWDE